MKKVMLTKKGMLLVNAELGYIKDIELPKAHANYKDWVTYGDSICAEEAKEKFEFYKERVKYLENMLITATVLPDEPKYLTQWAYEQACKALHLYEEISSISIAAMNKAYEQAEHEEYDTPKQLKNICETLTKALNAITDMKVDFSKNLGWTKNE